MPLVRVKLKESQGWESEREKKNLLQPSRDSFLYIPTLWEVFMRGKSSIKEGNFSIHLEWIVLHSCYDLEKASHVNLNQKIHCRRAAGSETSVMTPLPTRVANATNWNQTGNLCAARPQTYHRCIVLALHMRDPPQGRESSETGRNISTLPELILSLIFYSLSRHPVCRPWGRSRQAVCT